MLLTPVLGQVTVASPHMCPPVARCKSWRIRSIGTEIEVLTHRWDGPAIDHCAVAKVCGTADRGLCKCERTHQAEGVRQHDHFQFHVAFPSFARRNEERRGLVAICERAPLRLAAGVISVDLTDRQHVRSAPAKRQPMELAFVDIASCHIQHDTRRTRCGRRTSGT